VLRQLQELGASYLRSYTGEKLILRFRTQLFHQVQRLSLGYHDSRGTSDSTYRIQYDAPSIQYVTTDGVIPFVTAAFTLAMMLLITVRIDWQLAVVAMAISPVLFLTSRAYWQRVRRQSREVKKLESSALSVVQEVLTALPVVKAFGQEEREKERFARRSADGVRARIHLSAVEAGFDLILGFITALGAAIVLFVGVSHVQSGVITLGELLLVMGYLSQLYEPLRTISRKTASLQSHLAGAERAFALLDEAPDVPQRPDARRLSRASGSVAFRNASFAYEEGRPVLENFSFQVDAGWRVGIFGTTGAGKTTLVSLLTRLYDPTEGHIFLDGVDLREYDLADLRNQFAIVLQDPVLFSTSIAENIAYARPGASDSEIVAAAEAANAHEFIASLPEGYDTQVGERGMRLSGGERQRISLARAFLKDAPILILDEPTSSVDMGTEASIMDAIERLMSGRTTLIIAHRLNALAKCDVLLRIDHGRLVDVHAAAPITAGEALAPRRRPRRSLVGQNRRREK